MTCTKTIVRINMLLRDSKRINDERRALREKGGALSPHYLKVRNRSIMPPTIMKRKKILTPQFRKLNIYILLIVILYNTVFVEKENNLISTEFTS